MWASIKAFFAEHRAAIAVPVVVAVLIAVLTGAPGLVKDLFTGKPSPAHPSTKTITQGDGGIAVQDTGGGDVTIVQGVPHADHAALAKQLGVTEERYDRLVKVLVDAGIPPNEAPVRIPEMLRQLDEAKKELANAPKVEGATDTLRQQAERALDTDDFDTAEALLRQAETQDTRARQHLTDESKKRAMAAYTSAMALGKLANSRFQYREAALHFQRAAGHTPDTNVEDRIVALNSAGNSSLHAAAYDLGETVLVKARDLAETHLSADAPLLAIALNNLAQLYKATNRLDQAEPLMERALKIDEAAYGPDHPNVAIRLNNLGLLYQATNRLDQAEPLMERALKINEDAYGPGHPNVAINLNNLAELYRTSNRHREAEPLYERAVKTLTDSLGADHPNTQTVANNLAILRREIEDGLE